MKTLNVYLTFNGNCKEAMTFYAGIFGAELHFQTFGESPDMSKGMPEEHKTLLLHSEFKTESIHLMASDGMPGTPVAVGRNVTLNISFTDVAEQEKIFQSLSAGGKITMPLQDTFWGARFGMFTDKFGIPWMMNCEKEKS